jgi:hypothetical protein
MLVIPPPWREGVRNFLPRRSSAYPQRLPAGRLSRPVPRPLVRFVASLMVERTDAKSTMEARRECAHWRNVRPIPSHPQCPANPIPQPPVLGRTRN